MDDSTRYRRGKLWERGFLASRVAPWTRRGSWGARRERRAEGPDASAAGGRSRWIPAPAGGKSAGPGRPASQRRARGGALSPDSLRTGLHNRKLARVCFVLQGELRDGAEGLGPEAAGE